MTDKEKIEEIEWRYNNLSCDLFHEDIVWLIEKVKDKVNE